MQLGKLSLLIRLVIAATGAPIFARLAPWATVALVAFVVWKARKGAAKQVATAIAEARAQAESAAVASNTVMVNVGHGAGAHIGGESSPDSWEAITTTAQRQEVAPTHERGQLSDPAPLVALPVGQANQCRA